LGFSVFLASVAVGMLVQTTFAVAGGSGPFQFTTPNPALPSELRAAVNPHDVDIDVKIARRIVNALAPEAPFFPAAENSAFQRMCREEEEEL
jgi:hypothetical protein